MEPKQLYLTYMCITNQKENKIPETWNVLITNSLGQFDYTYFVHFPSTITNMR